MTDRTWRSASAGTGTLAETPVPPLPVPADAASRVEDASTRCRKLAARGDYDGWLVAGDELALRLRQAAGRVDLVGGA